MSYNNVVFNWIVDHCIVDILKHLKVSNSFKLKLEPHSQYERHLFQIVFGQEIAGQTPICLDFILGVDI